MKAIEAIQAMVEEVFNDDVVLPRKTHEQMVQERLVAKVREFNHLQRCCEFISRDPDPLSQNLISAINSHRNNKKLTWAEKTSVERMHEIVAELSDKFVANKADPEAFKVIVHEMMGSVVNIAAPTLHTTVSIQAHTQMVDTPKAISAPKAIEPRATTQRASEVSMPKPVVVAPKPVDLGKYTAAAPARASHTPRGSHAPMVRRETFERAH